MSIYTLCRAALSSGPCRSCLRGPDDPKGPFPLRFAAFLSEHLMYLLHSRFGHHFFPFCRTRLRAARVALYILLHALGVIYSGGPVVGGFDGILSHSLAQHFLHSRLGITCN